MMKVPEERLTAQQMLEHPYLMSAESEYESYILNLTCGTLTNLIHNIRSKSQNKVAIPSVIPTEI